jgi:HEAT repeat protein
MAGYYEEIYLENLFKDSGIEKQLKAIKELGKMQSKSAVPKLKEIANNSYGNINLRLNSILALAEIGDRSFIKEFQPFINQNEPEIIEGLIIAVGKLKAVEFIDEFEFFINIQNKEIKIEIIETLDTINSEKSVEMLIKFYSDIDIEIKEIVKFYLQKSTTFAEISNNMTDEEMLNVLTIVPKDRAATLIKKMVESNENKTILKILIKAIGELNIENSTEILKKIFFKESDKKIKIMIIEAMQKIETESKKEFLIEVLEDSDREMKTKALMSLGNFSEDKEIENKLKHIIADKNEWWMTKKIAIIIIGREKNNINSDFLVEILNHEDDSRVIRTIIQILGEMEFVSCTKSIEKYLNTKDIEIQKVAMYSLSKLGDKKILEFLLKNEEARENLMPESLRAMLNFSDNRTESILIDILKKRKSNIEMLNIAIDGIAVMKNNNIMELMINIIEDKEYKREIRAKAIMILAAYKDKKVEKLIKNILEDEEEWWMIKKLALILCKEIEAFSMIEIVIDYAAELDERLNKTARETAKYFYKNYFLKEFKNKECALYEIAKGYLRLL